jgi:hypothetical protein
MVDLQDGKGEFCRFEKYDSLSANILTPLNFCGRSNERKYATQVCLRQCLGVREL